ncbi:MAG: hypothetical protein E6Q40_04455, partial [Cupriavidus sp.]
MQITRHFSIQTTAIISALSLSVGTPFLAAENISPEQIQALQTDARTANEAITQVVQKSDSDEVKKDAQSASEAVGRIITELDKYAASAIAST